MSAEILRQAAMALRRRATSATPGPWQSTHHGVCTGAPDDRVVCNVASTTGSYESEARNRHYIAMMHPDVGRALADVLDESANVWDDSEVVRDDSQLDRLARLASTILGRAS